MQTEAARACERCGLDSFQQHVVQIVGKRSLNILFTTSLTGRHAMRYQTRLQVI